MALEPITRAEQIIAGKDLQPITRMEKFLKEYGGGSSGGEEPFFTATVDFNMSEENLISGFNYGEQGSRTYFPLVKLSDGECAKFINAYETGSDAVYRTNVMVDGELLQCIGFGTSIPGAPLIFDYRGASIGDVNTGAFSSSTYPASVSLSVTSVEIYLTGENKGKSVVCRESVELQVKTG